MTTQQQIIEFLLPIRNILNISAIEIEAKIPETSLQKTLRGDKYCNITSENIVKLLPVLIKIGFKIV